MFLLHNLFTVLGLLKVHFLFIESHRILQIQLIFIEVNLIKHTLKNKINVFKKLILQA